MDRLNALARRHNLYVLEDAAHAWGSQLDGKGAGTLGNCGTFSFQVSKNITAGEGGILVTNDKELVDLCRSFTHCGRRAGGAWYDHDFLGSNLRMTEFQAAILLAQLDRLGDQIARREANARLLDEALASMSGIRCLAPAPRMTRRSYHMYIFRLEGALFEAGRNRFVEALNAEGVPASRGWYRPLYANGIFQNGSRGERHSLKTPFVGKGVDYTTTCCPVCERVCQDAVWIPQNVLLAEQDDILRAAEAIRKVALRAR
jgi:dTDP-4-amino-4,6-dideoxygalactose transaminase